MVGRIFVGRGWSGWRDRSASVASATARTIILWAALATLLLTGAAYLIVAERAEREAVQQLLDHVTERGQAESKPFLIAEKNLEIFRGHFLERYNDPAILQRPNFNDWFEEGSDGAIRLRPEYFEGYRDETGTIRRGTSGFLGRKRPEMTPEFERRLIIAYELVDRFGPAWTSQFDNLHASFPENALIIHWPGGNWGANADPVLDMTAGAVIGSTLLSRNPERKPVWTGLYFDLTAGHWAVTYQLPVDQEGRHLINPSHDIRLGDLVRRLSEDHPPGARNLILSDRGELIAQPERMDEIMKHRGVLDIDKLDDPELKAVHDVVRRKAANGAANGAVERVDALDAYVAFARIDGPDWWFVTLYPRSLVASQAHEAATIILVLGLLLLALVAAVVTSVLRLQVARPLGKLEKASRLIAAGEYRAVASKTIDLPLGRRDEIGLLSKGFQAMASEIEAANTRLEQEVAARTVELQLANHRLEQLSLRDSLTGTLNRRALDRDLNDAQRRWTSFGVPTALLLCDIDHFKHYNDSYGHIAGDQVLALIASTIAQSAPDGRVYRYGGEEFALLLDPDLASRDLVAAQIVTRIAALRIPHCASPFGHITISVGTAMMGDSAPDSAALLASADGQLYRAKQTGRNRASTADPLDTDLSDAA